MPGQLSFNIFITWNISGHPNEQCSTVYQMQIENPNFQAAYPHNRNCTWVIKAPLGNSVNLTFSNFEMEDHYGTGTCQFDFLSVSHMMDTSEERTETTELALILWGINSWQNCSFRRHCLCSFFSIQSHITDLDLNGWLKDAEENWRNPLENYSLQTTLKCIQKQLNVCGL